MAPSRTPRRASTRQQAKPPVSKVTGRVTKATTRTRAVDTRAKIPDLPKTPGWKSGSADLFNEMLIRTPSPLKGKRITRRSSIMIQTIGGFGDVFKKPTTLGLRPPAASRQKPSLSTSPAMTRAKRRESVYLNKQTLQAEFHSVMSSIDTKITKSKIPRKKSLSPEKGKDSGSRGKRASSPRKRSPSPKKSPPRKSPKKTSPKKSPTRKSRKSPKKASPKKSGQTRKRSVSPQIKRKSVSPRRSKKAVSPKVSGDAIAESQKDSSVIVAVRESASITRKSSRLQTPRRKPSPTKKVASSKKSERSTKTKKSPGRKTVSPKPAEAAKETPASTARSSARRKMSGKKTPSPAKNERRAKSKSPQRKRTPTTTPKPAVKEISRKRLHSPESKKAIRTPSTSETKLAKKATKKATPARSGSTPKSQKKTPSRDSKDISLVSERFGRNQPLVPSPLVSADRPDVTSPSPSLRRVKMNLRKVVLTSPVHFDTPRPSSKIRKRPPTPGRATPVEQHVAATPPKAARILGKTPREKAPCTSTPVRASKKRHAEMPPPVSEIHHSKMSRLTVTAASVIAQSDSVMDVTDNVTIDTEMVEKELNGKEECKAVVKSWWSGWCTIL